MKTLKNDLTRMAKFAISYERKREGGRGGKGGATKGSGILAIGTSSTDDGNGRP